MSSTNVGVETATAFFTSNSRVHGTIIFEQPATYPRPPVRVKGDIHFLPTGLHALSINTKGDISEGGFATGPVIIELAPIPAVDGIAHADQILTENSSVRDILGRSLVVYAGENSSSLPIAWGVIGYVN